MRKRPSPRRKLANAALFVVGHRYGNLTLIRCVEHTTSRSAGKKHFRWECQCDCGRTVYRSRAQIYDELHPWCRRCGLRRLETPLAEAAIGRILWRYQRRASERGLSFTLTATQIAQLVQQPCYYCGDEKSNFTRKTLRRESANHGVKFFYNGIDRIDSALGYDIENVVPCCKTCNVMKRDMPQAKFLAHIGRIYAQSRATGSLASLGDPVTVALL